ncbi:hypothetical protein FACS1894113_2760 [Alphaproteobacteria bacterium]|nr:hypothetical protein FACS1894113_2760 [Alphaproteobacteria bacterium]
MIVKCPYCGCGYELNPSLLKDPIGSERLGYGWWLRCYKCHKKWWLKNADVAKCTDTPLKANRREKIEKLSKFVKHKKNVTRQKRLKLVKYLIISALLLLPGVGYYKRNLFTKYLTEKAKHLSKTIVPRLTLKNLKYTLQETELENKTEILITGTIVNEDSIVVNLKGVEISVFNENNEKIHSWQETLNTDFLVAKDSINFSSSSTQPAEVKISKISAKVF